MNYIRHDHKKAAMIEAALRLRLKLGKVHVINLLSSQGIPLIVIERVVETGPRRTTDKSGFDWG
jgi:hypothetical protein